LYAFRSLLRLDSTTGQLQEFLDCVTFESFLAELLAKHHFPLLDKLNLFPLIHLLGAGCNSLFNMLRKIGTGFTTFFNGGNSLSLVNKRLE
jgi:hypothetical protein